MPIEVPGVLSLIGGSPVLKSGDVFINKLKAAKTLDGGSGMDDLGLPTGLASLLKGIVNGGSLSSLMQNPIAAVSAILQGSLANGAASLTAALGGAVSGLTAAMTGGGGTSAAATSLTGLAATLSGATPGSPGPLDLVNHANLLDQFGGDIPPVVSFANASAPLSSGPAMALMNSQIIDMTARVIGGTMTIADASALVVAITAQMNAWITASNLAFSTMQAALTQLAALNALGASTVGGSPELQAALALIVQPATLATLTASASAMSVIGTAAIDANVTSNWQWLNSQGFLDSVQEGADR